MKNPSSDSGDISGGYGAWTCDLPGDTFFRSNYVEIQVHPAQVRIDIYTHGQRKISQWFTNETIRSMCLNLCRGGDCTGPLADAIDESNTGDEKIANHIRQCGEMIAKYYAYKKQHAR